MTTLCIAGAVASMTASVMPFVVLWESSDRVCGKRLVAMIPALLLALEQRGRLRPTSEERGLLLSVSAATIDRMLADVKIAAAGGRCRRVGFYSAIRREVPTRTFNDWGDPPPGFCEIDMVAHGGISVAGSFIQTLTMVDIATGWTECLPLVARDGSLVVEAMVTSPVRGRAEEAADIRLQDRSADRSRQARHGATDRIRDGEGRIDRRRFRPRGQREVRVSPAYTAQASAESVFASALALMRQVPSEVRAEKSLRRKASQPFEQVLGISHRTFDIHARNPASSGNMIAVGNAVFEATIAIVMFRPVAPHPCEDLLGIARRVGGFRARHMSPLGTTIAALIAVGEAMIVIVATLRRVACQPFEDFLRISHCMVGLGEAHGRNGGCRRLAGVESRKVCLVDVHPITPRSATER